MLCFIETYRQNIKGGLARQIIAINPGRHIAEIFNCWFDQLFSTGSSQPVCRHLYTVHADWIQNYPVNIPQSYAPSESARSGTFYRLHHMRMRTDNGIGTMLQHKGSQFSLCLVFKSLIFFSPVNGNNHKIGIGQLAFSRSLRISDCIYPVDDKRLWILQCHWYHRYNSARQCEPFFSMIRG